MRIKSFVYVMLASFMALLLSGCSIFTADTAELLNPPSLSGEISAISKAITESVEEKYTLKYPSKGNYRSAVIQNDINKDGVLEAFAFYSTTDGDVTTMHINVICNKDGKWTSVAQQKLVAGGVDKIEFCDLDNDGVLEILVGWEIYGTSEMQLAVYSFKDDTLTQRMLEKYSQFVTCDLDDNEINEIFVIKYSSSEQLNFAALYELTKEGVEEKSSCGLDRTVKAVNEPVVATLSSGKPAIYIDEIKGAGAVTEVLFYEKKMLINPLYDQDSSETLATLRSASLSIKDINNDGIIEIPVQVNVQSIAKSGVNEKLYLTNWCSYNGEKLTNQLTTMMNLNDGYYYIISPKLAGSIAVMKDTDNKVREIFEYDYETSIAGNKLLYFQTVKKDEWDSGKYNGLGLEEVINNANTSYICWISDEAKEAGMTLDEVKSNFKLLD